MFNKEKFSKVLQKINATYPTMTEFAKKASFDRTYISKYINMKLDNPPTPKILEKLASASNNIITYKELMLICNYIDDDLDAISGESISVFSNPYINKSDYTPSEDYIFSIIYTYEILETTNYTTIEKNKIIDSYNFIKNDKDYSKYLNLHEALKKRYYKNLNNNISTSFINIPVIGKIAAGKPLLAQEHLEGVLPVDPNIYGITNPDEYFYLRVSGNSMNQKVKNGDYALIHKQDYAENGDIIVAIVNGDDEATLKRYKKINDELIALEPQSDDESYETIYVDKNTNFQIIGKAIGQFGKF